MPSTREAAKNLVEEIARKRGFATAEQWAAIDESHRADWEKMLRDLQSQLGSAAITLGQNLYSNNARFVFELLQNADDNHYNKAEARGEGPYVNFTMYPDRIVVECNENGFTDENLQAICSIGQSSKKGSQGYTGEKGIGFKSVFRIAHKVLIQSGVYSFSFTHRKGDSGVGMIAPIWENNLEHVSDRITRMTLMLHDDDDVKVTGARRANVERQFKELQEGVLLFTKHLESIAIKIVSNTGDTTYETRYSRFSRMDGLVETKKITRDVGNDNEITETRLFHVTKHTASNLAMNENRTYSDAEIKSGTYTKGEVKLAFPLESPNVPLEQDQWIFAWMPIRKLGFKFIIQADFVTTANRQDIETTSLRNRGLAYGIAEAFAMGIAQLCRHPTLQYRWMRYLPSSKGSYPWDDFWTSVIAMIGQLLSVTPVLRPASLGPLRLIRHLKKHVDVTLDKNNEPLFADIEPELYLAPGYLDSDLSRLDEHGLQGLYIGEILARVWHDLNSSQSRMKHTADESWHSRAAALLLIPFTHSYLSEMTHVWQLDLLPSKTGNPAWFSAASGPFYYSELNGCKIPDGLDMRLLEPKACENPERRELFDRLGAQIADVQDVREKIRRRYWPRSPAGLTLLTSLDDWCFMYRNRDRTRRLGDDISNALLGAQGGRFKNPQTHDMYLPSDDPLGASKLLARGLGINGTTVPGFPVTFVDDIYLQNAPEQPAGESLSWTDWLHDALHVRRHVRLVTRDGTGLSDECKYVAEHKPHKFLSLLKALWSLEGQRICGDDNCLSELQRTEVLCRNNILMPLSDTYLPTTYLERLASRFLTDVDKFPWLELEEPLSHPSHPPEWEKLTTDVHFGVPATDLDFALDLMGSLQSSNATDPSDTELEAKVYSLYCFIEAKVRESEDLSEARSKVKTNFKSSPPKIYLPPTEGIVGSWKLPCDCVWGLPPVELTTKVVLERRYSERSPQFKEDPSQLASFFGKTLDIPKWSWKNIVNELRALRETGCNDFDTVVGLYKCLDGLNLDEIRVKPLRQEFQNEQLICSFVDERPSWHTVSECLWTSATRIPGKTPLNNTNDYDGLENFFLNTLTVQVMTIQMLYEKLTSTEQTASIDEQKGDLLEFSALLRLADKEFDPKPFRRAGFVPVKLPDGNVRLLKCGDGFAIPDRTTLAADFDGKAKLLDFDLDEVHRLRPFIEWAQIGDKYLSTSVEEIFTADKTSMKLITQAERDIARKAHALLRIAVNFGSPRISVAGEEGFYRLIRGTQTFETSHIMTTLHLSQDGHPITADKVNGIALQIDETSTDNLRIFVPRRKRDREACFHSKLPQYLFDWIMMPTRPAALAADAVKLVQAVLTAHPCALSSILDEAGVVSVSSPSEEDVEEEEEEQQDDDDDDEVDDAEPHQVDARGVSGHDDDGGPMRNFSDAESRSPIATPSSTLGPFNEFFSATSRTASSRAQPVGRPYRGSPPPRSRTPELMDMTPSRASHYLSLLNSVVAGAREFEFPSRGTFDMSAIQAAISETLDERDEFNANTPFILRDSSQLERDKRIGAAGELFVFELLSHLDPRLPGFGRPNWKSTIRSYVTSHADYNDLEPWYGRETADITYRDETGALTSLLADKGYMPAQDVDAMRQARPEFFIEVKSTTGPCEMAFYMSKHQYSRMQEYSQSGRRESHPSRYDRVYVIFRVYNLGQDSMGLRVLVDPERMRQAGELNFTADTWTVRTA